MQAFKELEERFESSIIISEEQARDLDSAGRTKLWHSQLSDFIDSICSDSKALASLIEEHHPTSPDVAMSLFVINNATWKLMEKKEIAPDRMLPMVTIPWFYWKQKAVSRDNPFGVVRDELLESRITLDLDRNLLIIRGMGGDFNGIVEGRLTKLSISPMRAIAPEFPGTKDPVPFYKQENIEVKIGLRSARVELYPDPLKELDYSFSESPKVFYTHGILIETDGKNVILQVGNRRASKLRGTTRIYLGRKHEKNTRDQLVYHVWLTALHKIITQNK